jgi:predicted DNA-binding antitoxin AbrB/MazE fold protein
MEIAAVYENGIIRPNQLLNLKHKRVNVIIVVPDEEIFDPLDQIQDQSIKQMILSMRKIRGTKINKANHGLTDEELLVEGLEKSGKY